MSETAAEHTDIGKGTASRWSVSSCRTETSVTGVDYAPTYNILASRRQAHHVVPKDRAVLFACTRLWHVGRGFPKISNSMVFRERCPHQARMHTFCKHCGLIHFYLTSRLAPYR